MTVLRIVFCILACICAAAAIPIGIFFEWWCLIPILAAAVFAVLMFVIRNAIARKEAPERTDFMNTDEENERIRTENENREIK